MDRGFATLLRVGGVGLRIHWSAPLGALAFAALAFKPWAWAGFFFLVLWHDLGHALAVRAFGGRVYDIGVQALGGACRWSGEVTPLQRAAVSWGGILSQAVLLVAVHAADPSVPPGGALAQLRETATVANALLLAVNLLPARPLDGASAWRLVPLAAERILGAWRARREARRQRRRLHLVRDRDELADDPEAFAAEAKEMLRRIRDGEPPGEG